MAHFIVTFRIGSGAGYQERYDSFVAQIIELAGGDSGKVWDETTSFYTFIAEGKSASSIALSLYLGSKFSPSSDMMVVIDLDKREKETYGNLEYASLLTLYLGF